MNSTLKVTKKTKATKPVTKALPEREPFGSRSTEGIVFLVFVLLVVSFLAGLSFQPSLKVFVVGEVASQDVHATQDLLVEEEASTRAKREEVADAQPSVFDLDMSKASGLQARVTTTFKTLNQARMDQLEQVRWQIAESLNSEISRSTMDIIRNNEIQNIIQIRIVPWLMRQMARGVVLDSRMMQRFDNGILVRDLASGVESLRLDLHQVVDLQRLNRRLEEFLRNDLHKTLRIRRAIMQFLSPMLHPTLTLNSEATQKRISEVKDAVDPVYYNIKRGEVIIRAGERVNAQDQIKLQALYQEDPQYFNFSSSFGLFVVGLLLVVGMIMSHSGKLLRPLNNRDAILIGFLILFYAGPTRFLAELDAPLAAELQRWFVTISGDMFPFSYPLAGAGALMTLYLPIRICFFAIMLLAFLCTYLVSGGMSLFFFYFLSAMLSMVLIRRTENRPEAFKSVFPLVGGMLLIWAGVRLLDYQNFRGLEIEALFVMGNAVLSLLMVFALSPIVELLFGYTSRFRLMELMNLEQPLLQELMVAVPGTYHHSLIVANMVEAGARAIGANPLLCKVAALYHDIGKLKNPQYYIENQYGSKNIHDKLAPSMSALILISHVKKGVELAREHKLGARITDVIRQHHGTSLISFFYNKAMEQAKDDETIRKEEYRYPGPKPQSKEAGLVMIADIIEASSRSLSDPTPSRIKGHIQTITRKIFTEGQLDDSELTMKDLNQLEKTFTRILTGIFHQRVEYPGTNKEKKQPAQEKRKVANNGDLADTQTLSSKLKGENDAAPGKGDPLQ